VRVGIDLVSVESVREALETHADHYLERVYTEDEVADCASDAGVDAERLAARFAAKEAALKVLRPRRDEGLSLRTIEVRRSSDGWVGLSLSGDAAAMAREQGLSDFELSISHDRGFATAVVVAARQLRNPDGDPMQGS
jgi:holo-[acyl-carrier protein] synthase